MFSTIDDVICWTTGNNFFIEYNNELKSNLNYNLDIAPYYNNPILIDNYLYYIGGIYDYNAHEVYIARIDYTEDQPKLQKLTEIHNDIFSYTVCNNNLFYISADNGDIKMYIKNLSSEKEDIIMNDIFSINFCTNGETIIMGNKIFDIKTKEIKLLSKNENLIALGIIDSYYYCYCNNSSNNGYEILQIDLNNNSVTNLCLIPYGMDAPKMRGDKILFTDISNGCLTVGYYYYDILENNTVTVVDSDNSTSRYSETSYEPVHYDYTMHNNMYYFQYSDIVTRININTKQEELLQLVSNQTDSNWYTNQYEWISYSDYCAKN